MRTMRGPRAGWIGLGAGIAGLLVVVSLAAWSPWSARSARPAGGSGAPGAGGSLQPTESSVAPGPPGVGSPGAGPVVYYEVLDADGSSLIERRLDGRSAARRIAVRTDVDYGRTWTVDPTGSIAIAAIPGADDEELEAVAVDSGASRWSIRIPSAPVDQAAWSADGRRVALASIGSDTAPREVFLIDAESGGFIRVVIPEDAVVQGFAGDGGLILRRHVVSAQGVDIGWRFLRVDPASGAIGAPAGLPDVGPTSDGSEDVDPAAGLAVDVAVGAHGRGAAVRLWTLADGTSRTLASFPSIDWVGFDPAGSGVAVSADGVIRFVAVAGASSEVFRSEDAIGELAWSAGGDYLAVRADQPVPNLTVIERATGRTVALPHPDAVAQLDLVRIVGGVPLPAEPLPGAEPSPSPTAGPAGPDVAGFGGLLSAWVDRRGATQTAHVERLVPTESGGLRAAATMPPLDLGPVAVPDDGGAQLQLLPRPGSTDILLWVTTSDRASGWLWDGGNGLRALPLPPDWPAETFEIAWRPDGQAIAAAAGRATASGDIEAVFAIASTNTAGRTTVVRAADGYERLEGWWSSTELRVGHGACPDACAGRFAWSARLRIRDDRLVELTPADRAHAVVDQAEIESGGIVLSAINGDSSDDITIAWPSALGRVEDLDLVGFEADGRSFDVVRTSDTGSDLLRIADPIGRAVHGRLDDPQPITLVHLDRRGLRFDVSPDGAWATATDRIDNVRLVRLSDGRTWPVGRDRQLAWPVP